MSKRECDDDYGNIVAQLGPKHRVIACSDNVQWIVQRRTSEWRSIHFCTSREGVIRRMEGLPGWEVLADLPDHFPRGQGPRVERKVGLSGHIPAANLETGSTQ